MAGNEETKPEDDKAEENVIVVDAMELLLNTKAEDITDKMTLRRKQNGKSVDFVVKVRAIDEPLYQRIQNQSTKTKVEKGERRREFDQIRFRKLVVYESVVEPNLRDMLEKKGVHQTMAEDIVPKVFLPGEIEAIGERALVLSGFNSDVSDLKGS